MAAAPRIVLTREREANRAWADRLRAAGLGVHELPLLRFDALPVPEDVRAASYEWILFTSPQGVRAFATSGIEPGDARFGTLGAGTRAVLEEIGHRDDLGVECLDGAELAREFVARADAPARVLLPGPERRMKDPRQALEKAGFAVTELPLYATGSVPPTDLPATPCTDGDLVFFCSPSTVRAFVAAWDERPACVAIGETTASFARETGFETAVADTPDLEAMIRAAGLDPLPETAKTESES